MNFRVFDELVRSLTWACTQNLREGITHCSSCYRPATRFIRIRYGGIFEARWELACNYHKRNHKSW